MQRSVPLSLIAVLALVQALFGALRALEWFNFGSDAMGQGLLIMPLVGAMAYARGMIVIVVVSLYVAFAVGSFMGRDWAFSVGGAAAVINLLLVTSVLWQGAALLQALLWSIVPLLILWCLLSRERRTA